ncbi:HEAT repeat protein-like protein [Cryomyces antarcticus]
MAAPESIKKATYPELDIQKLHSLPSEQQDLYLLTFTSDLASHVSALDADSASAHQIFLKKELFQILTLASPPPTRVIRNNLGRSFAGIFGKGDRKLLYESINELLGIVNSAKGDKDLKSKHAAVHCLGAIYGAAGDSVISLSSLACTSLLRVLKLAQNYAGFRGTIFKALGNIFRGIGSSADEPVARDVWKQARSTISNDKSFFVQASACWCLEQLSRETSHLDSSSDFDKLQTALLKAIDSTSPAVRHAAASCMSSMLVRGYSDSPGKEAMSRGKKPKKASKKQSKEDGEEEDVQRPGSPALSKPITQLSLGLLDLLKQLSTQYCRPAASNRARAGISVCYIKTLKSLGENVVQTKYGEIASHLFNDLSSHPLVIHNRYRQLITRKYVRIILESVVGQMLGETGQMNAAKYLINNVIIESSQTVNERPEPTKQALISALSALASLIKCLGAAINSIAEICRDALLQVLQHPSYTVQVYASYCLQAFVLACPQQLLPSVTLCMNSVNRELNLLAGPRRSTRKCVGYANGLAAVLGTSDLQPMYSSVDVYSRVLSQSTTLLKSSGSSDLRISSTQIQVAWTMIGGLMSLGPNFVKIHLSQLLLLWKNALPKPLNRDNMVQRSVLELSFLSHVRECALGSIMAFLEFNSKLLTLDVCKRLAGMLQNTIIFLNSLPAKKGIEDVAQRLSPSLQLQDFELMVRRRVLQCYTSLFNLSSPGSSETLLQSNLLPLAVSAFADPDRYSPSSLSISIASSAGTFESVWDVGDNCGFGVTGLIEGLNVRPLPGEQANKPHGHWMTAEDAEAAIDRTLLSPVCGAREHDAIALCVNAINSPDEPSDPPSTEVVNAAIRLFAVAFPLQAPRVQESILEQMSSFLSASSLQRDPARKTAMTVNVATALLSSLKVAVNETQSAAGDLRNPATERAIQDLLHTLIVHSDQTIRAIAAEAFGRLCSSSGNNFTSNEVNNLVDLVVSNRDPNVRSGCAMALGSIHAQLGGMAAGYHLKNILGILMSLSADPHPTVHFWALESLSRVADSAGLTFSGYVSSTLGMLAQLYVLDSHNQENASFTSSNLEMDLPTVTAIARCTDSVINVLGPDLQDMAKARDMIMTLVDQFQTEEDPLLLVESLRCLEHLSLYAPGHMDFTAYVQRLQRELGSGLQQVQNMAVDGLYNLMRRDAEEVIRAANPGLEDQLWNALDSNPDQDVLKNIFRNWLQQTGLSTTAEWIQRCHTVLTKIKSQIEPVVSTAQAKRIIVPDLQDEEVAGFAVAASATIDSTPGASVSTPELLRWQVRAFAMDCLSELLSMVAKNAVPRGKSRAEAALQQRVADVVRIAFSASTASVVRLRVRGLGIIDQLLKIFGKTPDPDFAEALLLEQYQAQISSALTPAFAADSSPELAAEAVNVCATFIATGIVTDVERMGRILKLLISALESFSGASEVVAIGDLKTLSPNAQVMVKMAVFSAWAELQIASLEQKYLVNVVQPYITMLAPLWLSSLREFARLRFEPDTSTTSGTAFVSGSLDTVYATLNRETLLKFYQDSWLNLVDAIASLIDEDSDCVFNALDGIPEPPTSSGIARQGSEINYRDEPVAFFFVLFGLAFEALVGRQGDDSLATKEQTLEILLALKKILRPSVSGHAIYREVVFSETMDMLDRIALTEGLAVQSIVVEIARNLCLGHPSARRGQPTQVDEEHLSEDIDQLFELTRIIVLVLAGVVPNLTGNNSQARHELSDEAVSLIRLALNALVDAAEIFPSVIKTDLHACIIHVFATILSSGVCQASVVSHALPIFKRFVTAVMRKPQPDTVSQVRGALARFLVILENAQKRESEAALPCERNTLLASTILLTSVSSAFQPSDPLIGQFIDKLIECLESRMTTKIAASCSRSLLLLPKGGSTESAIAALTLPRLLSFLVSPPRVDGLGESRSVAAHALTSFVSTLQAEQRPTVMALVVPALLARTSKEGQVLFHETSARLLDLANVDQKAFRGVVANVTPAQRLFLEEVIREGNALGRQARPAAVQELEEPSIALKMDFGG